MKTWFCKTHNEAIESDPATDPEIQNRIIRGAAMYWAKTGELDAEVVRHLARGIRHGGIVLDIPKW